MNKYFIIIGLLLLVFIFPLEVFTQTNNPNEVLRTQDFYLLPIRFSSASKIQEFLNFHGSVLANYRVKIEFHHDDNPNECDPNDYWFQKGDINRCQQLPDDTDIILQRIPDSVKQTYYRREMLVSEFIWELTQGSLNNGCSGNFCIDHNVKKINPAFILAIIQKESGLVYGPGSKPGSFINNQSVDFRMDRATGYLCLETPDRSKSCWDENPDWKYFKGFFRQVYYASRWFRIWTQRCDAGENFAHNGGWRGKFYTGSTVIISNTQVYLSNGITCAMYIYTPHISFSTARIMKETQGDIDFINQTNRDPGYIPRGVATF